VTMFWKLQREEYPASSGDLEPAYIGLYARPALSEWSANSSIIWRRNWYRFAKACRDGVWVVCLYAFAMLLATRRRARKFFLSAFVALFLAGCAFFYRGSVAGFIWPGDLRYLNDYAYRTSMDWETDEDKSNILIAYEKQPWEGERRIVAYMNGKLGNLKEDEFRALAAEQGIDLPSSDSPPPDP
jgi:hypothetical protein